MPPINGNSYRALIQGHTTQHKVVLFIKSTCPKCTEVQDLFKSIKQDFKTVEIDKSGNELSLQQGLFEMTGNENLPSVYINSIYVGGIEEIQKLNGDGRLRQMLQQKDSYDYDLIVIGGGSGGLAAAKEAAKLGMKAAVFDFVKPSPPGTTWGLGGTCVNVGCIPKKLMHQASLLGHQFHDAREFGWDVPESVKHSWDTMKNAIQDHIGGLNWNYRVQLRDKGVDYHNYYAEFVDAHKIKGTNRKGKVIEKTAKYFLLAMGLRPRYPDIPGAIEYGITSDDLFSLPYCPGKTLVVGASYVSLECGGFLASLGLDVTIMVRSILLRGFDQQMAEMIGEYMANHDMKFIRPCVPTKIEQLEEGQPGKLRVTAKHQDGREIVEEYNTVIFAIGRDPCTKGIGLDKIGVQLNKSDFVIADERERTSVPNVYAVGDILEGKPELTPVAIQAGRLLVNRLFGEKNLLCDYTNIATTVFTPLEYGSIGYSEEDAVAKFGEDDIEVYHQYFWPLEWTVAHREENTCYAKLICHIPDNTMRLLLVALAVTAALASPVTRELDVEWQGFKAEYGKTYTLDEEFLRRMTWENNLRYIQKHNLEADRGLHSFRVGMNSYGDLTDEEFTSSMNGYKMSEERTGSKFLAASYVDLPSEVDWRTKGYVTPVKDQKQCGSCWAFAAVASLEGQHFKADNQLVSLSEQNLVDCSRREGNHGCEGGLMDQAFEYIKQNKGIDTEASYPYRARDESCHFNPSDVGATDTGFVDIEKGSESDLQKAAATIGPIAVAIDASQKSFRFYKNGVYDEPMCSSERLDHGVTVVGYGTEGSQDYWLVKNSWGESWGNKGYINMSRNKNNQCGIATAASYPLV